MRHYFAYGTLLDKAAMTAFAPSAVAEDLLRLDGYEMGFAETHQPGKGGCSLVARPGAVTWGLHYALSDADMERMDRASGIDEGLWVKKPILATDRLGRATQTITYTIPGEPRPFTPSEDYVRKIVKGLAALDLPPDYVARMRQIIDEACART
jgi:hypothetical protein